jgi:outer membrane lipoprotein-sorting protein
VSDSNQQPRACQALDPAQQNSANAFPLKDHRRAGQDRTVRAPLLLIFVATFCGFLVQGCRESQLTNSPGETASTDIAASTTPPYSTKEPDRYQATRLITIVASPSGSTTSVANQTGKVLITRDGVKRREEYISQDSERMIYLEIPSGRFVVLPADKVYADLEAVPKEVGLISPTAEGTVVSTEALLNEVPHAAKYQSLGTEVLDGRTTTKYRVTTTTSSGETNGKGETLIWIDESLGMPVRSETMDGIEGAAKVIMELKDITLNVDADLFEIPGDYKKVSSQLIHQQMHKNDRPKAKDQ